MLECRHIFQRVLSRWFSTLGVAIVAIAPISIIPWYGGYTVILARSTTANYLSYYGYGWSGYPEHSMLGCE